MMRIRIILGTQRIMKILKNDLENICNNLYTFFSAIIFAANNFWGFFGLYKYITFAESPTTCQGFY